MHLFNARHWNTKINKYTYMQISAWKGFFKERGVKGDEWRVTIFK